MAKDLTAEDIGRETYLFKYNMDSDVIGAILSLVISVPLLLVQSLLENNNNRTGGTYTEITYDPDYDPLNPPYIE